MSEPGWTPEQSSSDVRGALRRHWRVLLVAGVAVLAMLAGLLVVLSGSDSHESAANRTRIRHRAPFDQALANLATARGLHYKDTSTAGISRRDITVSQTGMLFGTTGSGPEDLDQDVLKVGGKTFTRWKKPFLISEQE